MGLFPASDSLHWYFAAAFFLLMFASILVVGVTSKGMARASVVVGLVGFVGLAVLTPLVEAALVYIIGLWVVAAALTYKKAR